MSEQMSTDWRERARRYFQKPGFARLLQAIWGRYASLGRVGGTAVVRAPSPEEVETVCSFMGWYLSPGENLEVRLMAFEEELQRSAFPLTIPELHELLTGSALLTKAERQELLEQDWVSMFGDVRAMIGDGGRYTEMSRWLTRLQAGQAPGYRTLRELWKADMLQASSQLACAASAWQRLIDARAAGGAAWRLPVLSAAVAGDPHALDRSSPAGRLLFQALREWTGHAASAERPDAAAGHQQEAAVGIDSLAAREIYRLSGILDDDISSLVHLCRPGEEPYVLTLRQVETLAAPPVAADLFVVENPAVFSSLADGALAAAGHGADKGAGNGASQGADKEAVHGASSPLLVGTSGPASAAALRLFDRMYEAGQAGRLHYSGDFDVKGIAIGNVLALRYPGRFTPWRFDEAAYTPACGSMTATGLLYSGEERQRLLRMAAAWDEALCPAMAERGRKLFQEELLDGLLADWLGASSAES